MHHTAATGKLEKRLKSDLILARSLKAHFIMAGRKAWKPELEVVDNTVLTAGKQGAMIPVLSCVDRLFVFLNQSGTP